MSNKMGGDWQYYRIEKRLDEITDLLGEVLRRLGKLEYSGEISFSDGQSIWGSSKKNVSISLQKKDRWDRLKDTQGVFKTDTKPIKVRPQHKLKTKEDVVQTDIHGNPYDPKTSGMNDDTENH